MGLIANKGQTPGQRRAAIARYKAARKALNDNAERERAAGITQETDEYLRLNAAVVDAERDVPWIHR